MEKSKAESPVFKDNRWLWERRYPEGVKWRAPILKKPLFHVFDQALAKYPDNDLCDFEGKSITYRKMGWYVDRVAKGLQDLGVKKGTKVGLLLPNTPYFIMFFYGILKTGATVVNYDPLYAGQELSSRIEDSETDILVTIDLRSLMDKAGQALSGTRLRKVIVCPMAGVLPFPKNLIYPLMKFRDIAKVPADDRHIRFKEVLDNPGTPEPVMIDAENDIAVLQYAGGATGVLLTHGNLYANVQQIVYWIRSVEPGKDTMMGVLPFSCLFSLTVAVNGAVWAGMKIILHPEFVPEDVLKSVKKHRPAYFPGDAAVFRAVAAYPKISGIDFSCLKFCMSAGAPMPAEVKRLFEEKTGCRRIGEGYGLADAAPVVAFSPSPGVIKNGSVGMPLPGTVVEIIDCDDGVSVMPQGEKGEVCIYGPQVAKTENFKKSEETAGVFRNGRLHTGDIGYMDGDGYLFLAAGKLSGEDRLEQEGRMTVKEAALKNTPEPDMPWLGSYPEGVAWDIEIPSLPMCSFLEQTVLKYGDRTAISSSGQTYTYADLGRLVAHAAKGLQVLGVGKGTNVGLFMPNSVYSIVMYYAILKSGGTVVNYNPSYVESSLIYQITDSETDMIVTLDVPPLRGKVLSLLEKTRVRTVILCPVGQNPKEAAGTSASEQGIVPFCDLIANDGNPASFPLDFEKDIAVLQYTGGTTGIPKGAALSHKNIVANALQGCAWNHAARAGQDSTIAVLPLFHVFAMTAVMNMSVMQGIRIILMPQFDVKELFGLIHREKPDFLAAVPAVYIAMMNHAGISGCDFSSLRFCLSGGAPLPVGVKASFEKMTGVPLVVESYGLTEFSPVATCNPLSSKARAGSIGVPMPLTTVEIISLEDGVTPMKPGEKGEICVRGPQMMLGYYKKPEETAEVIRNGRLHTGDVGYMDADGFVYIVDRIKDMILVGGCNVYPRHVEEAIYRHPAVAECIVAGVTDKLRGEMVHAWVVPAGGVVLDASELRSFLQDKLSHLEMPRKITVRGEPLPKTVVGKLSRKDLLEQEGIKANKSV
ncbi:MAG: AMP-binding protein [Pseudomonadota bacterium]